MIIDSFKNIFTNKLTVNSFTFFLDKKYVITTSYNIKIDVDLIYIFLKLYINTIQNCLKIFIH